MTTQPATARASTPRSPCASLVTLITGELAGLATVAGAVYRPAQELACQLETGHRGPHAARAQRYSTRFSVFERWLYWRGAARRLVTYRPDEMCTAVQLACLPFPGSTPPCRLPAGHAGRCQPPTDRDTTLQPTLA